MRVEVIAILKGGLEAGVSKVSDPRFSHFVALPLLVINKQSLRCFTCIFVNS